MVELQPKNSPMLRQRATECPPELREQVIAELQEIYNNPPWGSCAGMAAPQIGHPYNIFIAQGQVFEGITSIKGVGEKYSTTEGCYSVPHETHVVKRYPTIKVRIGNKTTEYTGFMAQVIQHEYDHCLGKLISDKE